MMKRLAALLLAILMMPAAALADIAWHSAPPAVQQHVQPYVRAVNAVLSELDAGVVDMAYEVYPAFVSLGIDGIALPDDPSATLVLPVEMQFSLSTEGLYSLTLRVSDIDRFADVAAACLHACSPAGIPLERAQAIARSYASVALADRSAMQRDPATAITNSFEEEVVDLQGNQPRAYFAYWPDQYGDGVTWLQMTLIFPLPGSTGGALVLSTTPEPGTEDHFIDPDADSDYEGYLPAPNENVNHLETFATPTPEPDSAAMERW